MALTREQAIELARSNAKALKPSYYEEPFQPHEWVIAAIMDAAVHSTPEPNVLNQLAGQWEKLASMIAWKLVGSAPIEVSVDDISKMMKAYAPDHPVIIVNGKKHSMVFKVVSSKEGERLAALHAKNGKVEL